MDKVKAKRTINKVNQVLQRGRKLPQNYNQFAQAIDFAREPVSRLMNGYDVSDNVLNAIEAGADRLLNSVQLGEK